MKRGEILRQLGARESGQSLLLVVLGSGMNRLFSQSEFRHYAPSELRLTDGHPMELGVVQRGEQLVLVLVGRRHLYEGEDPERRYQWYDLGLDCKPDLVLQLSAAGGLNPLLHVGSVVLHTGYLAPTSGLGVGMESHNVPREDLREGEGWPRLRSDQIARQVQEAALHQSYALQNGVYAFVPGPSYETRAEIGMLRRSGADLVGMSTLPEVMRATRRGLPVIGASLVTNCLSDTKSPGLDHSEVTDASRIHGMRLRTFIDIVLSIPFLEKP